jgi:CBS domain-containing protein
MHIDRIYSRNLVTVSRSCNLEDAARLMRQYHVGALIVIDDEAETRRAIGIVTDRDLVLQAMANGVDPRLAVIGEVMTDGLVTVSRNADLYEAIQAMRTNGVRRLAVSDGDGRLVGVVSLDDVIAAMGAELGSLASVLDTELKFEREEVAEQPVAVGTADGR